MPSTVSTSARTPRPKSRCCSSSERTKTATRPCVPGAGSSAGNAPQTSGDSPRSNVIDEYLREHDSRIPPKFAAWLRHTWPVPRAGTTHSGRVPQTCWAQFRSHDACIMPESLLVKSGRWRTLHAEVHLVVRHHGVGHGALSVLLRVPGAGALSGGVIAGKSELNSVKLNSVFALNPDRRSTTPFLRSPPSRAHFPSQFASMSCSRVTRCSVRPRSKCPSSVKLNSVFALNPDLVAHATGCNFRATPCNVSV